MINHVIEVRMLEIKVIAAELYLDLVRGRPDNFNNLLEAYSKLLAARVDLLNARIRNLSVPA